jgi:hypothetical protein
MKHITIFLLFIIILLIYFIYITCNSEKFHCIDFHTNLDKRISSKKYPFDKIVPLRPINVKVTDCELCVFGEPYKFYDYGDYIAKQKNKECPPGAVQMNSCV